MVKKKFSYPKGTNKRKCREQLIPSYQFDKLVGLAGPNFVPYIEEMKAKGFKDVQVYEFDSEIMMMQLPQIPKEGVKYSFGDILNAEVDDNTFYDLDFCSTVKSVEPHIKKFRKNFAITVSVRGIGKEETRRLFVNFRNEQFIQETPINEKQKIVETNTNKYLFTSYFDSSPMVVITEHKD